MDRRKFIRTSTLTAGALSVSLPGITGKYHDDAKDIKIGMIGLDTSHSPAFAKFINDPANLKMQGFKVAYAYPRGSSAIESSASRIPQYTKRSKPLAYR